MIKTIYIFDYYTKYVLLLLCTINISTDMEFDVNSIDFGCCTIYEAVKRTVKLTNHSILSQQFGFIGLPEVRFKTFIIQDVTFSINNTDFDE